MTMAMDMTVQNVATPTKAGTTNNSSGKPAEGAGEAFGALLSQVGTDAQQVAEGKEQPSDSVLSMLAALAGGLSPVLVAQPLQADAGVAADGVQALAVTLTMSGQSISIQLQQSELTGQELAQALQQFGASPELLSVLHAAPQQNALQTLAAHPAQLAEFGQVLTQMVQTAVDSPQVLARTPQVADLLKTITAQLTIESSSNVNAGHAGQALNTVLPQGQKMLGKLQATLTMHSLHVAVQASANAQATGVASSQVALADGEPTGQAQATSAAVELAMTTVEAVATSQTQAGETARPDATTNSAVTGNLVADVAGVARTNQSTSSEPVIAIKAEKFQAEMQQLIVKRAALIEAPGRQEFRIILEPQGLGEIEVRIQKIGKQLSVQFTADTTLAKGMLDAGLAGLKASLQTSGIQLDRVDVSNNAPNQEQGQNQNSGLPQERGNGQGYEQPGSGQPERRPDEVFTLEGLDAVEEELTDEEESLEEVDGLNVTA